MDEIPEQELTEESVPEPSKKQRVVRITFWILIITVILLLAAWFANLIGISIKY